MRLPKFEFQMTCNRFCAVVFFVWTFFYFYSKCIRQEKLIKKVLSSVTRSLSHLGISTQLMKCFVCWWDLKDKVWGIVNCFLVKFEMEVLRNIFKVFKGTHLSSNFEINHWRSIQIVFFFLLKTQFTGCLKFFFWANRL